MKPLDDSIFLKDDGLFCRDCYEETFAYKCRKCDQLILTGEVIDFQGFQFHDECFSCVSCSKHLVGIDEKNILQGQLYCEDCERVALDKLHRYKCDICQ